MSNSAMKKDLEQQLVTMQGRLASLKKDATREYSGDSAEQAQERENDEVVDAIGIETAQSIRAIQAALERIEEGSYGVCDSCGEDIGEGRLKAVPEATRCVGCSEQEYGVQMCDKAFMVAYNIMTDMHDSMYTLYESDE